LYFKARNYYQALRKYGLDPGFEISDPEKNISRTWIQRPKKHRIRIRKTEIFFSVFSDLNNMLRNAERWRGSAGCSRSGNDFLPLNRVFLFPRNRKPYTDLSAVDLWNILFSAYMENTLKKRRNKH
jgi:hypothetical protein